MSGSTVIGDKCMRVLVRQMSAAQRIGLIYRFVWRRFDSVGDYSAPGEKISKEGIRDRRNDLVCFEFLRIVAWRVPCSTTKAEKSKCSEQPFFHSSWSRSY